MRYLSDEWFEAAGRAIASANELPPNRLVIDQTVTGVGRWRTVIDPAGSSLTRGLPEGETAAAPDAAFTQSVDTAVAIASGAVDAHEALLLGQVEFSGDVDAVIAGRDALTWLAKALAPVMQATTLP